MGEVLDGRYELLERLGAGGMGVVWRARHVRLDREVAVKVLADHIATDPTATTRFEREARAAAALHHDHLAPVHDFGHDPGGRLYLVMPLLRGQDLAAHLKNQGPLAPPEALRVITEAAAGLAAAHAHGLVHRDVKPANLFLTHTGRTIVLDFGLARATEGTTSITAGTGTWAYMAPEQYDPDEHGPVGPAADTYALAAVLHEATTGQRPFPGAQTMPQLYTAHTRKPRPQPSTTNPALAWLDPVIAQGMNIDPRERHPTVEALAHHAHTAWQQHTTHTPPAAPAPTRSEALEPVAQARKPAPAAATPQRPQQPHTGGTVWQQTRTLDERTAFVAFSPNGRYLATGELSGVNLWDPATRRSARAAIGVGGGIRSAVFSPDGRWIAVGRADPRRVLLIKVATGERVASWRPGKRTMPGSVGHSITSVAFSPDSRLLATTMFDGTCELREVPTGQKIADLVGLGGSLNSVAFSPDGTVLATGGHTSYTALWETATARRIGDFGLRTGIVKSVAFSPNGTLLATGSYNGHVELWDPASRKQVAALGSHTSPVESVAFSPDGTLLATGGGVYAKDGDTAVRLWDVASRKMVAALAGHTKRVVAVAFSPDGRQLATGGEDQAVRLWRAVPAGA